MKASLFSTPIKGGTYYKRELEHQDAMVSVMRRLTLIDSLTESLHQPSSTNLTTLDGGIMDTDIRDTVSASLLILRNGGLSIHPNLHPQNVSCQKNCSPTINFGQSIKRCWCFVQKRAIWDM